MVKLYLHNTLTRKKEEFKPIKKGRVSFYHCGPTVYWTQHIGNLRGMTCGDIVVRGLRYLGYKVKYVRNYTDVGHLVSDEDEGRDKMDKGAEREHKTAKQIAEKYIKIFENDAAELNLLEPDKKPRATAYVKEIIKMAQTLVAKGYAYSTDLAVYFDVSKAKNYGRLSGQKIEDKITGAGKGEISDPEKKHQVDFALWFFKAGVHANALQFWPSPFKSKLAEKGQGFPGWHLECSAMSKKLLGDTIDIHLGGIEHIPVHHTNEIAQSEAANGVRLVNYWLHNEHLLVDNKKMAKSEGASYTLEEVKDRGFNNPLVLRYFFLQAHYRSRQNFTWQALAAAKNGFNHLVALVSGLGEKTGKVNQAFKLKFISALADDFNLPQALAVAQELLKADLAREDKLATILDFDKVLGLKLKIEPFQSKYIRIKHCPPVKVEFSNEINFKEKNNIMPLIVDRLKAKIIKNFQEADKIRKEIENLGYYIEDISNDKIRVNKR